MTVRLAGEGRALKALPPDFPMSSWVGKSLGPLDLGKVAQGLSPSMQTRSPGRVIGV
jgi:hypothetical protein